ncbi:hypothetical protein GPECTOR_4g889 [Gonium pectorale]|uniref:Protein CASP n=1 Tax=Gonium pectorale TaxID=33097 RepID=A0A150GYQ9_GONPE|nr:hypothetical protein GPECTOR_4g889 [Gonium pectorale]|eukprot:KXZ54818.1 hypothetical protein GPECTOR_4g889 [Gonium pectorale]
MGTEKDGSPLSSPLSVVCNFWRELDLEGMRTKLDEIGLKVAEHQEDSMQNRRKLAEATRDFKRNNEAVSKTVGPLLKQYQEEIDRLTKRAKHGETAFLDLYQKLYEAPDPAPALASAFEHASRATDLEAQCKKLATELAEYKAESTHIKNQDLTVRKLEEKVRALEAHVEERDKELEEVRSRAVAEADAARLAAMQGREAELEAMLSQAQASWASLAAMQKLYAGAENQLFAIQSQSEEERMGRQAELELASAELERAQDRLAALEREKEALVAKLQHDEPGTGSQGGADPAAAPHGSAALRHSASVGGRASAQHSASIEETLRSELGAQRELASRLRSELASVRAESEEAREMLEARLEGLRSTLAATEQHAAAVEQELAARPTQSQLEDLRQQLRVLQAIGYNSLDVEGDEEDPSAAGAGQGPSFGHGAAGTGAGSHRGLGAPGSLEAMLLSKNRHLEHELTMAKLKVVDVRQEADQAAARVVDLEAQLAEQVSLVRQLEEDLLASRAAEQRLAATGSGGAAAAIGMGSASSPNVAGLVGGAAGGDADDGDASMLRVLCAQRDRLRARCHDLEEELTRLRAELTATKSAAAAAKADNIALIERLRYVHSRTGITGSGGVGGGGGRGGSVKGGDVEAGAEVERRYGRMYDEGINPFKEFKDQQKERQKSAMGLVDKAMFMLSQLVYGNSAARMFAFLYLAAMHALVFASILRMTHHSSNALYSHTQAVMDNRHNTTALMHHEGAVAGNHLQGQLP